MHFVELALTAEGPTDHDFFGPLIRRTVESICALRCTSDYQIAGVLDLDQYRLAPRLETQALTYLERIVDASVRARGSFSIMFVHRDGANRVDAIEATAVGPIREALVNRAGGLNWQSVISVIPVYEMEAWAIADGNAIRAVFGTTLSDEALGIPVRPGQVEAVRDPKSVLAAVYAASIGTRTGKKMPVDVYLSAIAEQVSLDVLGRVQRFAVLREAIESTLETVGTFR